MPSRLEFHRPKGRPRNRSLRPTSHQRGYGGRAWQALRRQALIRDNWQCRQCGKIVDSRWDGQVDHIRPKRQGGEDRLDNLQVLCLRCHARKTRIDSEGPGCP